MYTNLYIKSNYTLLSSLIDIKKLVSYASQNNIKALALTDDNLTSTMLFYHECVNNNIKPIIGMEIYLEGNNILLYAKDYKGYQNLIKLSTKKTEGNITFQDLKTYNKNILAIIPYLSINILNNCQDIYNDIYIGFSTKEEELQAKQVGIPVFINKVLYLKKDESKYMKYLYMLKHNKTISDDITYKDNNNYILLDKASLYSSNIGLNNTNIIANKCNINFPKEKNILPIYDKNINNSAEYLKSLSIKGLNKRLNNNISNIYKERLLYELNVINKMEYSNYFLIVYDFIKYSKKNNILVTVRGSAGASLVAYSLGITDIDPIKYDLLFERFLNPNRITMPDIDTDFPDIYREQVINYVKNKYGEKNVSGIITFGTLSVRLVIRNVAKILNIPSNHVDNIIKYIPEVTNLHLKDFYNENKLFRSAIDSNDKLHLMYEICTKIEGFPHHTSAHAAGIVISSNPLDDKVPLVKSDNMYLTGYTMEYLEELGLLKMDFLGLKNLTTIMNILNDINTSESEKVDFNNIPLDDSQTFEIFRNAKTTGIFQFESNGMRKFLSDLKPTSLEDLFAAIALFRPGPANNIDSYIRRKNKEEEISYIDPSLKKVLEPTYGIIIYQEQIMQIANIMADYSFGEADILRRAMSKKKMDILKEEEPKFIEKALKKGYDIKIVQEVYNLILKFANYGFNKSHSVSYAIISYKMAYLKCHYPKYFYSNLLTQAIGSEIKTKEYIDEIRSHKIQILLPDIIKSEDKYITCKEGILYPLSNIRNIGLITCQEIILKRKKTYKDIFECICSLLSKNINKKTIETLIDASCFDRFGYNKHTLHYNLDNIINYALLASDLDESLIEKPQIEIKEEYNKETLLANEKEVFGMYLNNHPATLYKHDKKLVDLKDIKNYFDQKITFVALVDKTKEITTKRNEKMAFATVSDETSSIEVTIFPGVYKEKMIEKGKIYLFKGIVNRRKNEFKIIMNQLEKLN